MPVRSKNFLRNPFDLLIYIFYLSRQLGRFDDFTIASSWERSANLQWCYPIFLYHCFWSILVICEGLLRFSWSSRFISEIEAICRQWLADGPKILMVLLCLGPHIQACAIIIDQLTNIYSCSKKVQRLFLPLKNYTWSNVNWSMGKEFILWSIISWSLQKVISFKI